MKHLFMLCIMLVLVVSLIGCAGQEITETAEEESAAAAEENGKIEITFSITLEKTPQKVFVAGNFNGWNPKDNNYALMDEDGDGTWEVTVRLAPGTYQYKFVVDNEWTLDAQPPSTIDDGFGGRNGVIEVQ